MDETTANPGSAQDQQEVRDEVVESSSETTSQPTLSYDTYKRTVGEVKKVKSQLSEAQERLKAYEQKEMEAAGQHSDLIAALRAENTKLKTDVEERDQVYQWSKRSESLRSALAKQGCIKPDHLLRLMDEEVLNQIEIDDNYNPVMEDVTRIVDSFKGDPDYGYLFRGQTHSVDTVNPASRIEKPAPRPLKDIPINERIAMLGLDKKETAE